MLIALLIALSLIGHNPDWADDDYRFGIADQFPGSTRYAIALVQSTDCTLFEDLTTRCP